MRVMIKIGFFSLLIVATFLVQNARAALVDLIYLPDSSYAEEVDNWQGHMIYEEDGFNVLVEFTVYDTLFLDPAANPDESSLVNALQEELDLTGQYIYAYQIFNHPTADEDIESFAVFNEIPGVPLVVEEESPGWQDDGQENVVQPSNAYLTLEDSEVVEAVWEFKELGEAILLAGEHSYFLVFSSKSEPVVGDFEIKAFEEGGDFPISPEPTTIALLGVGGTLMFLKRRDSVQ